MIRRIVGDALEYAGLAVLSGPVSFVVVGLIGVTFYVELVVMAQNPVDFMELFLLKPGLLPSESWVLAILAHESLDHLLKNILILLMFGVQVEREISSWWIVPLFFALGLGAGLLHTNVTGNTALGASGAAMGFAGLWFGMYVSSREVRASAVESIGWITAIGVPVAVVTLAVNDFFFVSGTAGLGHLAGAILGCLVGIVLGYVRG